jgi:hypothetical protein
MTQYHPSPHASLSSPEADFDLAQTIAQHLGGNTGDHNTPKHASKHENLAWEHQFHCFAGFLDL